MGIVRDMLDAFFAVSSYVAEHIAEWVMILVTLLAAAASTAVAVFAYRNGRDAKDLAQQVADQEKHHREHLLTIQQEAEARDARIAREEFAAALTLQTMYDFERLRNGPNQFSDRPSDQTVLLLGAKTGDPSRHILTDYMRSILSVNPFARGDDRSGLPEFAIGSIQSAISEWIEDPSSLPDKNETLSAAFSARDEWEKERNEMNYRIKQAEAKWAERATFLPDDDASTDRAADGSSVPPPAAHT